MSESFDEQQALSLAAKLDAVDFSDDERALLIALFHAASGADVEGFSKHVPPPSGPIPIPYPIVGTMSPLAHGFMAAFKAHHTERNAG